MMIHSMIHNKLQDTNLFLTRAHVFRLHMLGVLFGPVFVSSNSLFSSSQHIETEALFHTRCLCTHKEMRQL